MQRLGQRRDRGVTRRRDLAIPRIRIGCIIPGVEIPVSVSPVIEVQLESADGVDLSFAYRKPAGKGPFPTILFFHGGGGQSNLSSLRNNLMTGAIQTRFLAAGYLAIASTRRPYWKSKGNTPTGFYDSVADAARVVERAKTIPGVNANSLHRGQFQLRMKVDDTKSDSPKGCVSSSYSP